MSIAIFRLLFDFGLVVLIWIIQAVVYPSFLFYNKENLIAWHKIYTSRFSIIVIPLMLGQLGISIYLFILSATIYTVLSLVIISLVWLSTFLQFVPIHSSISKGKVNKSMLVSLVNKNWIRTLLWTILLLYSFVNFTIKN